MDKKIVLAANLAKLAGYTHIASVIKSKYDTTYYHIVAIDDILACGNWIAAPIGVYPTRDNQSTWHGRVGINHLPDYAITRQAALALVS